MAQGALVTRTEEVEGQDVFPAIGEIGPGRGTYRASRNKPIEKMAMARA